MRLRKVLIENFRGLKHLELDLDDITILIGENNCGKTSVLEAIRIALSRAAMRRIGSFEDHDYHLADATSSPGDSGTLQIILEFIEGKQGEWPVEVIQGLADAVVLDSSGLYHLNFVLSSSWDKSLKEFITDWNFVDANRKVLPKAKRPVVIGTLQNFVSVFYLTALRDAVRDFSPKSTFWGPFLRNPSIPDAIKTQLEGELVALNDKIIGAEQRLKQVSNSLEKAQKIVSLGQKDTVSIEAIPSRIWDMLSRAQVNVAAVTGASLPLVKHGAGTQSLATIFLFESFLAAGVNKPDPHTSFFLQIEEPEVHLHPSAIRSLWPTLAASPEQKIIATHSGDLLSEVPLTAIRRLKRTTNGVEVRRLDPKALSPEETRKAQFHIRRHRGELFFARVWLLHEGETEYWILSEIARLAGIPIEENGIRLVEYANVGLASLLKLADQFGIQWHCLCDGDQQGKANATAASALLNGRSAADHISVLSEPDIEHFLCNTGFGGVYEGNISSQSTITVKPGHIDYWPQVLKSQQGKFKVPCAIKVIQAIEASGTAAIPNFLVQIVSRAVALSGV